MPGEIGFVDHFSVLTTAEGGDGGGGAGEEGSSRKVRPRHHELKGSKETIDKQQSTTGKLPRATVGPWASGFCEEGAGADKKQTSFDWRGDPIAEYHSDNCKHMVIQNHIN